MIRVRSLRSAPFRIRRETLVLLAVALAIPFIVSHRVHERELASPPAVTQGQPAWTGRIADLSTDNVSELKETITSASLVVPTSTLALPPDPPHSQAKPRPCTSPEPCLARVSTAAQKQRTAAVSQSGSFARHGSEAGFLHDMNPLEHLPSAMRHPLDSARAVLTGWFRQL